MFENGGLLEEEENWSILDSSERMMCVRRNDVDGVLDRSYPSRLHFDNSSLLHMAESLKSIVEDLMWEF